MGLPTAGVVFAIAIYNSVISVNFQTALVNLHLIWIVLKNGLVGEIDLVDWIAMVSKILNS